LIIEAPANGLLKLNFSGIS